MRKLLILGLLLIGLSSCTQEYICQCEITYTGSQPNLPEKTTVEHKIRDTKKEAAKKCEANNATSTKDGVTFDEKCRLY